MPDQFNILDSSVPEIADALVTGEETFSRALAATSNAILTGNEALRLCYFTARKTESISQVRVITGSTAAGATPTLIRIGVWTANGAGALLAQQAATASDTSLLAASATRYTKAFAAPFTKQRGQRYAVGILVVTAATLPTLVGHGTAIQAAEAGVDPMISAVVNGQADLPATVAAGSITGSANRPYFVLLP